ncbi:hypothetical protein TYRP_008911 [Tyrophagus putrescentiae]|nr:hypothetical protein TYRP_008911 [Tyrophagus putrescentiae]
MATSGEVRCLNMIILFCLLISDVYFLRLPYTRAIIIFGALALNTAMGLVFTYEHYATYLLVFAILQLVIPFVGLVSMVSGYIGASACTAIIAFVHIYKIEQEGLKQNCDSEEA